MKRKIKPKAKLFGFNFTSYGSQPVFIAADNVDMASKMFMEKFKFNESKRVESEFWFRDSTLEHTGYWMPTIWWYA